MTRRAAWILRALFFAFGLWTAAIGPFISVILQVRGFDPAAIGFVSAFTALALLVVVPAWGHVADVLLGRARALQVGILVSVAVAVLLLLPVPSIAIVTSLASFALFIGLFNSLTDALAVDALSAPEREYGSLRALSSLSFTIGVISAGFLYNVLGYGAAPVVSLVWSAVMFLLVGWVTDRTQDAAVRRLTPHGADPRPADRFGSIGRAFAVQPRLVGVLAMFTLAYAGVQGGVTFVSIRIVELGGHPSDVALTFGISALFEVPGLIVAGWLARRVGLRILTAASLIGFGLCIGTWAFLPSPDAINATRLLTGLCYGSFTAARVLLVARLLPAALQATGQGLVQAATMGIGTVAGTALGGPIYGLIGAPGFFLAAAAAAIIGGFGSAVVLGGPVGDRAQRGMA